MRTWPEPSILPSMVRSAAISDSFSSARAPWGRRSGSVFVGGVADMELSRVVGLPDGSGGGGVELVGALGSFQSAMGQVLLVTAANKQTPSYTGSGAVPDRRRPWATVLGAIRPLSHLTP